MVCVVTKLEVEQTLRIKELEEALENALGCWVYDGVSDQHETVFLQTTRVMNNEQY